jgi:TatD DNase family protein
LIVDSHCHLNFDSFDIDRAEVLRRAEQAGVVKIVNPGLDLDTSREAVSLAEEYHRIYAAVGVHPNEALTWKSDTVDLLENIIASSDKVIAVGEIGLDYYRDYSPKELQQSIFEQQLRLAGHSGLPVIIHSRNVTDQDQSAILDILSIIKNWQTELRELKPALAENPGVLHSFSGNHEVAEIAVELGLFLGISGRVTYKNASELRFVVANIPLEKQLIETDSPFLTPHPYRGKRNEPAYVAYVAEKLAEIHDMPIDIIAEMTSNNAQRLFKW